MNKCFTYIGILLVLFVATAMQDEIGVNVINRPDFQRFYDAYKVNGTFLLYDQNMDRTYNYNPTTATTAYTPASTFKIVNTLIGIETGVITDENMVIKWDGIQRQNPSWNKDQDLQNAFKNSTVWYYQEIARRIGGKRMKEWLHRLDYGNADTSGGVDKFWLTGGLRITPQQQLDFLRRFYTNRLAISPKAKTILQKIMLMEETPDYKLSTKTGWGMQGDEQVGWYLGYLEFGGKVYYFVNCIQTKDQENAQFAKARVDIARNIFSTLEITRQ